MAEHFKDVSQCYVCRTYLEDPVRLKCGYVCCLQCVNSLPKELNGEGVLCPFCPVVSQKKDIRPISQLGKLVSTVKELEPQLRAALQMNPKMKKFRVDMTLDVDTANNHLIISDDLRKVRCGCFRHNREEHAERFNPALCVLGTPQFTSGRHYWEVHMGTSNTWDVGVCKESVNRRVTFTLSSEFGFWTVGRRAGPCLWASTGSMTPLWVGPWVQHVGVFLDMDMGILSFYNLRDGSHIFTFTQVSAPEPLRPFFAHGDVTCDDQGFLNVCTGIN
ncbi:ret finger protein-like 4A [Carlito syrichta]|uniref:Ret finger protein-like 4A n=1 Tax=Carlito syrichta TaxID=1868482 RepID=A0A3Q0DRL7_CARSF|nr:ret finger protein-like 4A [Carlito syrichta]